MPSRMTSIRTLVEAHISASIPGVTITNGDPQSFDAIPKDRLPHAYSEFSEEEPERLDFKQERRRVTGEVLIAADASNRVSTINALDDDASNWVADAFTTVTDEATIAAPGSTKSLRFEATSANNFVSARHALDGATDFTGKIFTIWVYLDTAMHALAVGAGQMISIRLETTAPSVDYGMYHFLTAAVPLANTWYQLSIDADNTSAASEGGTFDLTSIKSIQLVIYASPNTSTGEKSYFDEVAFLTGREAVGQYIQSIRDAIFADEDLSSTVDGITVSSGVVHGSVEDPIVYGTLGIETEEVY